ncbi:MAG: pyridoxal-phosphate dependent enzyme [Candidatus Heimdallarchaeaceae archaeon]
MWRKPDSCQECGSLLIGDSLRCPTCEKLLSVTPIRGPSKSDISLTSMWSFRDFLPEYAKPISLYEGNTPLIEVKNIENLADLSLKLEFRNPTGSFRDRASSLIISDVVKKKYSQVISASTGSFSISLSAYAAKAGIKSLSVVPQNLELSKIEQLKVYGSDVIEIGDSVEESIAEAERISKETSAYLATPENNLLAIEGQKTLGLEIVLQKEFFNALIVPRGSGSLIYSIYRGLEDAFASGWIEKFPRIYAISLEKTKSAYMVESLEIEQPFLLKEVRETIKFSEGKEIEIDAQQMIEEALNLSKKEGLFIEPASASVLAAADKLIKEEEINPKDSVAILSGSGFNALNIYATQLRDKRKVVWGLSESSTTKFEILNLITEGKATYGISLWESLGRAKSKQSIYQHLNELQEKGLIVLTEQDTKIKKFKVTKKGFETLEKMRDLIDFL